MQTYDIKCKDCLKEHIVCTMPAFKQEFLEKFICECTSKNVEYFKKEREEIKFLSPSINKSGLGRVMTKACPRLKEVLKEMSKNFPGSTIDV